MIVLEGVERRYRVGPMEVEALRGVSLEIRRGDLLSITGPSGCGKSTLMGILGLLDRPTGGVYRLEGRDVATLDDATLSGIRNARIGFVFQSFHLLARMTAAENVALPLAYRSGPGAQARERAREALAEVGMADRAAHRPGELSGGQQQRVALARALVGEPAVVLADEPTGALDPDTGEAIMGLLERLSAERSMAVVIVTHDRAVAARCPRRARMVAGRLGEEGR